METQIKTLWLLECRERGHTVGRLYTFYACSPDEAEHIAKRFLGLHPELTLISLNEKPKGFIYMHSWRPGKIEVTR